jgi:hypothetical protein
LDFFAEGNYRHPPFNSRRSLIENPIRNYIVGVWRPGFDGFIEHERPRITPLIPIQQRFQSEYLCNVLANRMPFITMDTALTLLQVDRIGWEIPVDHAVAPSMKV